MDKCQELVRTYIAAETEDAFIELVDNVNFQTITLLHVVKSLGEYLTSDDGKIREKGVKLLSNILARCQPERVNKQSTRVLVIFYREKLQDSEVTVPALEGLLTLSSLPTFGPSEASDTALSIIQHVTMKVHIQSTRYVVFRIIDMLLANHLEALKETPSFLPGYIKLAEGEKDPRNLLVAFNIAKVIILEFDISPHIDDLFDITFCYFPITFKPPPNDPYGITSEDLKSALRSCLSATPRFGPLALPLFLEKLSATSPQTKRDTLKTLSFCLPVYGPTVARTFASQMWSAFKLEPLDSDTATKAVNALTTLLRILYQDKDQAGKPEADLFEGLAEEVITECIRLLREPEKNQAQHAIKIVNACLATTPNICSYTLKRTIPFLISQFNNPDEASHRDPILAALRDILHAINELPDGPCRSSAASFLEANKDATLGALTAGLRAKVSRGSALSGLLQISSVQGILSPEEMSFIVHNINELLGAGEDELGDLRPIALEVLNAIALVIPKLIEETTLPMLFAALPDHAPARDADEERAKYWAILGSLSALSMPSTLFEVLVIRLSTKLDIICATPPTDRESEAAYALALLNTISNVLSRKVEAGHADVPKYIDRLLPALFRLAIKAATATDPGGEVATHPRLIPTISTIVILVVRSSPATKQAEFAMAVSNLFYRGQVNDLPGPRIALGQQFQPFNENASPPQRNLVSLFTASLLPLHLEAKLPFDDLNRTLSSLIEWCISDSTTDLQSTYGIQLLSSLINKHAKDAHTLFEDYLPNLWQETAYNPRQVNKLRIRALKVWAAVARALVVRNHPKGEEYTEDIFKLLEDYQIGKEAGKAIGSIASNNDDVLTKQNYCAVRLFALQRFCSQVLPRVINGYKESNDAYLRESYLVALAALIRAVPKASYTHLLPTLVPILLLGLGLSDADLRINVLETLLQVAKDSADVVGSSGSGPLVEHAGSLVKASLANIQFLETGNPRVQICALQLLAALPSTMRYDLLHPYKAQVLRQLGVALDDRKRAVRKEAVDCRAIWYQFNG
ncbi:MMS19 nucleotide excision repair protein [Ceratobasidium sp. AG-Ba]|nr:MMS19 nucleotide excision repair protein [Ceratobasidium sp. AG-Ba]